jgi:hypothetical protein
VSSAEIHRRLGDRIAEGTFGRAKAALGIEHRRVREDGRARSSGHEAEARAAYTEGRGKG